MEQLLFKYLLVQILEKLCRFKRFLEKADIEGRRSDLDVIRAFKRRIDEVQEDWHRARVNLVKYFSAPDSALAGNLLRQISTCQHDLEDLHLNLSYVKEPWTCPETDVFVTAVFENLGVTLEPKPSVVLSDVYVFEETDLASYLAPTTEPLEKERTPTPTLFLPKLEFENPLQWPMLIHEMGHAIRSTQGTFFSPEDVEAICGKSKEAQDLLGNWLEEIYEDLVSIYLLGPAYLASFVELATLISTEDILEGYTGTHPHSRLRLFAMTGMLNRRQVRCSFSDAHIYAPHGDLSSMYVWLYEMRCYMEREFLLTDVESPNRIINPREFVNRLAAHVEKLIPVEKSLSPFDSRKFSSLSRRLQDGVPIGSYSPVQIESGDESAIKAIKELQKAQAAPAEEQDQDLAEPLRIAMARIKETPCTVAEVINAGWIYKCEKVYHQAILRLPEFKPEDEERFKEQIFGLDALLRNSIETSFLCKLFLERFSDPRS